MEQTQPRHARVESKLSHPFQASSRGCQKRIEFLITQTLQGFSTIWNHFNGVLVFSLKYFPKDQHCPDRLLPQEFSSRIFSKIYQKTSLVSYIRELETSDIIEQTLKKRDGTK